MGFIDFILNIAGLLLWLSRRSLKFDPLARRTPRTLAGTLRPAQARRLGGWQLLAGLLLLLFLRALLYWEIGSPANWTPKLHLGLVVLAFRSDLFWVALLYSLVSFLRVLVVFYFWLIVLGLLNRATADTDPIPKMIRQYLGRWTASPAVVQLLAPLAAVTLFWCALHPLLRYTQVTSPTQSFLHLVEQGALISLGLVFSLKLLLPPLLLLHLVTSYVYLGSNPVWDFVSSTSRSCLAPLRRLPLRVAKLDFAPVAGVVLILLLLHWLPNLVLSELTQHRLTLWPR